MSGRRNSPSRTIASGWLLEIGTGYSEWGEGRRRDPTILLLFSEVLCGIGPHCMNRLDGHAIENLYVIGMEGRTAFVVAHRLSTVARMDRLIVLDRGRIIEQGTHQELLDLGGTYARLWQHQSGGFLDEAANPRMLTTAQ